MYSQQECARGPLLVGMLLLSTLACDAEMDQGEPDDELRPVLNIAHRGGSHLAPEETMPAFENAVAIGVDMLELDVHASADGVVVLCHDVTVDDTTDGTGLIKEMTLAELRRLDAGYWFTRDGGQSYPFRGQGVQIATLEEVLSAFPESQYTIELKQDEPPIVDAVLEVVDRHGARDRIIFAAVDDGTLQALRAAQPPLRTSFGLQEVADFALLTAAEEATYEPPAEVFQVPDFALRVDFIERAHRLQLPVQVWTVNDPELMHYYIGLGVDGIITDDPATLQQILDMRDQD